jgi:hypothetical protein
MTATAESPAAVPPPRPPRPGTVTVAFWLQLATVLILLGLVALVVVKAIQWDAAIDQAVRLVPDADPDEVRAERWNSVTMAVVLGAPALLLALWLGLTAPWVRVGSNTARTMVFVAGALQMLLCIAQGCLGAFVIPFGLAVAVADAPYVDETYPEDVPPPDDFWQESDFIEALYSQTNPFDSVLFPLAGLGLLLVFLLTAAVVLLLALPPAHRWFVPRAEPAASWPPAGGDIPNAYLVGYPLPPGRGPYPAPPVHPVLGHPAPPAYPAYPGYPGYPGYPAPPGHPAPSGYAVPGAGYVVPGAGYVVPGAGYVVPGPGGPPEPTASQPAALNTPEAPTAPATSDEPTAPGGHAPDGVPASGGDTGASGGGEQGGAASGGSDQADR